MAAINIASLDDLSRFAGKLANLLGAYDYPPLLLQGPLGCGKTTLVSRLAPNIPGGKDAEVSSPSFTICNLYPTAPPILHCDLYRCKNQAPEEMLEFMESNSGLLIVEWAEFLGFQPLEFLDISFFVDKNIRRLKISGNGPKAKAIAEICAKWDKARTGCDCGAKQQEQIF